MKLVSVLPTIRKSGQFAGLLSVIVALLFSAETRAQATVRVLNIPYGYTANARSGDPYTLLQTYLVDVAMPKLINPVNFGPAGTVKTSIKIENGFELLGSITSAAVLEPFDIIFIGGIGRNDGKTFTDQEISYLLAWSIKPGNVLIVAEQSSGYPISKSVGLPIYSGVSNPSIASFGDGLTGVKLFSGPFGKVPSLSQAGSAQGFFDIICNSVAIAWDNNNKATMVYNLTYNDVYITDTDFFSLLNSQMQWDNTIDTNTEKAWGNLWAWAVNEVANPAPPLRIP